MNDANIARLSPAAARLLAACLYASGNAYEDIVKASGIADCVTLIAAKQQLHFLGFIVIDERGNEQVIFPRRG